MAVEINSVKRITDLTEKTALADSDLLVVGNGGTSTLRKIKWATILDKLKSVFSLKTDVDTLNTNLANLSSGLKWKTYSSLPQLGLSTSAKLDNIIDALNSRAPATLICPMYKADFPNISFGSTGAKHIITVTSGTQGYVSLQDHDISTGIVYTCSHYGSMYTPWRENVISVVTENKTVNIAANTDYAYVPYKSGYNLVSAIGTTFHGVYVTGLADTGSNYAVFFNVSGTMAASITLKLTWVKNA